jgi:outer membrane receptor protein involved in Fe transport
VIPAALGTPPPTSLDQYEKTRLGTDQGNYTEELRVASAQPYARLQWTAGFYYSDNKQHAGQSIEAPGFPALVSSAFGKPIDQVFGAGLYQGLYSFYSNVHTTDKEVAEFANAEFRVTEQLAFAAGLRVSKLENTYHSVRQGPFAGGTIVRDGVLRETPVTPRLGINFKADSNNLFYISAAKGFRAGGINEALPVVDSACTTAAAAVGASNLNDYKSDSLWSYEIGAKNRLMDGKLNLESSIYQINWNNIQRRVFIPACLGGLVTNFGAARIRGFDLTIDAAITPGLTEQVSVGYTHGIYSRSSVANGVIYALGGSQISTAAPWNISASLQYEHHIAAEVNGYLRVEDRYSSKNDGAFSEANSATAIYDPFFFVPDAVNRLDMKAGVTWRGLEMALFANNVLNQHPFLYRLDNAADLAHGAATIRPLTVGLTGSYRW